MRIVRQRTLAVTLTLASLACSGKTIVQASPSDDADVDSAVVDSAPTVDATPDVMGDSSSPDAPIVEDASDAGCTGLRCNRVKCSAGTTSISGTVYMPNGSTPLYGAWVYIPNGTVAPLPTGAVCAQCGMPVSGDPLAAALSDVNGKFTLNDVPVGTDVPVVIQSGKWRKQIKIPKVFPCTDNPLGASSTRLPRKQSEGDMPRIAVTVGACDTMACLLPKIGIDASEFGVEGDSKAVHFYTPKSMGITAAGPAGMTDANDLWGDETMLAKYDIALFSCECYEAPGSKMTGSYAAVTHYLAAGGRILTNDFQYTWYKNSTDPALVSAATIPGGGSDGGNPVDVVTTFPKAKAFSDWMGAVAGASSKIRFDFVFNNISAVDAAKGQTWATSGGGSGIGGPGTHPRIFSVNTPAGRPPSEQCGRAIHVDAHMGSHDSVDSTFPANCSSALDAAQYAEAFLFFEAQTCIQDESLEPTAPPAK